MEKTEPLIMIWECTKCKHTEFRDGNGPHICKKKRERKNLFDNETHIESCGGRMEPCRYTDTDVQNAKKKSK
jgi:hypothetical protein